MDPTAAAMTPEERLAKDLCCECGTPLQGLDVTHHSMQHWVQFIRPDGFNQEAIRRQGLMADYATAHPAPSAKPAEAKTAAPSTQHPPTTSERR